MPTLANTVYGILAACSFNADPAPAYLMNRGFAAAITRTGAGDYTLTLDQGVNFLTECIADASIQGSTPGMIAVEPLTTTTCRIRTLNAAGAATDLDFYLSITRILP